MTSRINIKCLGPAIYLLPIMGSIMGFIIDRTSGRGLSNLIFFSQGLTPDGIHYSVKALEYLGFSDSEIISSIKLQYQYTSTKVTEYFLNPDSWEAALVDARVLYPLISAGFVKFIGLTGMLIVPTICYVLLALLPVQFNKWYFESKRLILIYSLAILVSTSFYLKFNILANTTDGLSTLLIVTLAVVLYRNYHVRECTVDVAIIPLLCVLTCMTRQNEIYVIGFILVYTIKKYKQTKLYSASVFFSSLILVFSWLIFSYKVFGNYKIITSSSGESWLQLGIFGSLLKFFQAWPTTMVLEFVQLWVRDPGIFIILIIAIYVAFASFIKSLLQQFLAVCIISGISLTSINSSYGSGFRYALPAILISVFVIIEWADGEWKEFVNETSD